MRLNSALISTFLFVSAVLADYDPKKQQPPLLNHVEKSINRTSFILADYSLGGAAWKQPSGSEYVRFAAGTFTVPEIEGPIGSGFNIALGIGALEREYVVFGVGITVTKGQNGVSYVAWGTWYPTTTPAPDWFAISVGHVIGAVVQYESPTAGIIALINLTTGAVWAVFVSGQYIVSPYDAEWVITALPGVTLASFQAVTFTVLDAQIDDVYGQPNPAEVSTFEIVRGGQTMTNSLVGDDNFILITYIG